MGLPNPSRETKFSGTNGDREIFIFSVQLTTCRTGNLTRLIHTLAICTTIHTCRVFDLIIKFLYLVPGIFIFDLNFTTASGGTLFYSFFFLVFSSAQERHNKTIKT